MTDAKQAARELAELMLMESAVITASDIPWLDEMFAQALEAFAAERVREERERWTAACKKMIATAESYKQSTAHNIDAEFSCEDGVITALRTLMKNAQPNEARP